MRRRLVERRATMATSERERLVHAARSRLVTAALSLRPGASYSLRLARFRVHCSELLLHLAEGA